MVSHCQHVPISGTDWLDNITWFVSFSPGFCIPFLFFFFFIVVSPEKAATIIIKQPNCWTNNSLITSHLSQLKLNFPAKSSHHHPPHHHRHNLWLLKAANRGCVMLRCHPQFFFYGCNYKTSFIIIYHVTIHNKNHNIFFVVVVSIQSKKRIQVHYKK